MVGFETPLTFSAWMPSGKPSWTPLMLLASMLCVISLILGGGVRCDRGLAVGGGGDR